MVKVKVTPKVKVMAQSYKQDQGEDLTRPNSDPINYLLHRGIIFCIREIAHYLIFASLFSYVSPLDLSLLTVGCGRPAGIVCMDLPADVLI